MPFLIAPSAARLAAYAIGALAIVLALIALYAKGRSDGAAAIKAADAIAISKAQQKADALANELVIAQAQAMATNEKTVTVYKDRIIHAPSTSTCGPVLRDAADGVCALIGGSGANGKCDAPSPVH